MDAPVVGSITAQPRPHIGVTGNRLCGARETAKSDRHRTHGVIASDVKYVVAK